MNILLTGATGLLGNEIRRQLTKRDDTRTFLLLRNETELLPNEQCFYGDILDYPSLLESFEGIDLVIHAAAKVSFSPKEKEELFNVNVNGTTNVVNACLEKKVKRLVYISSVAAVGKPTISGDSKSSHDLINVNENHKWEENPNNSAYGKSKYLAEQEVWRGQAEGLQTLTFNPSIILGEGDWTKSSTQLFRYVYKENTFFTDGFINYIDVQDLSRLIVKAIDSNKAAERYIVSAGTTTYKEFFQNIATAFDKKAPRIKLGIWPIEILWRIEAIRAFFFGATPLITKETSISAQGRYSFMNNKVKQEFGIEFTPLKDSIERVCQYLKKVDSVNN
ncbi:NAD-dependent epimerase/dehydratase family protein [Jiulongibacter sp. NS-SX5]|uniref:NAD-dependent epimerase/dehydratase family protein n=1 Tax=Jiulongibacter sp. NS-SX5 TaxID=3463854 RepID=UPI004059D4F2